MDEATLRLSVERESGYTACKEAESGTWEALRRYAPEGGHVMTLGSALPGSPAAEPVERPVHILVVEDELFIRMFISDAFRDAGYTVIEAFNADEAVDILKAGKAVDLVFSDVRMPGSLDGVGLLRFIKERFSKLPVILASGHLDPRVAFAEGAEHLFSKPYQIGTVLNFVATKLDKAAE